MNQSRALGARVMGTSMIALSILLCPNATTYAQGSWPALEGIHDLSTELGLGEVGPRAGLIQASDLNFYGMSVAGGTASRGTIFRMTPAGDVTILHSFSGEDGRSPYYELIQARDGHLYGTTSWGGDADQGVAFKITLDGTFTLLHSFTGGMDGGFVQSELLEVTDGSFYGTAPLGGAHGLGVIFKLTSAGNLTTVYSFSSENGRPIASLIEGADGSFYGTAGGGSAGKGIVYRMTSDGTVTTMHSFQGPEGSFLNSGVVQAVDGNFYGVASNGGLLDRGGIFRMTPSGEVTMLFHLATWNGQRYLSKLLPSSDLHLYGTITGQKGSPPGCLPFCGLGTPGYVFKMDLAGHLTTLGPAVASKYGTLSSLVQARDGNMYGVTTGNYDFWGAGPSIVYRLSNYAPCTDKLTVSYHANTLNLGFTLATTKAATWSAWLALAGPPEQRSLLWSVPVPAIQPAVFVNLPVPNFPQIGPLIVLTSLQGANGPLCVDWKVVETGP